MTNRAILTLLFIAALMPSMPHCFASAEEGGGNDRFMTNAVAVKVNSQNISVREVEALYNDSFVLIQDKLRRGELAAENVDAAIHLAWAEALTTAIQDKLLDQRAEKRKREIMNFYLQRAGSVVGTDKALEMFHRLEAEYVRALRREKIMAAGGEDELRKALKRNGQTMQQWEDNLPRELFRRDIVGMEMGQISVRPTEVKEYYEKHPEQFGQPEAWRLARIRIAKAKFSSPEIALAAAKKTKARIDDGADFAEVAAAISDDPIFAKNGGLMTRNGMTDLPSHAFPEEERIAAGMKDGQISDPIEVVDAYVLLRRLGHQEPHTKKFEEVSDKAEALVYNEKFKRKKKEMVEKQKRESYIEVLQEQPPEQLLARKN